jgi:hypothetical protein
MWFLAVATLLLTPCSYSENGGERWNRIQLFPSPASPTGAWVFNPLLNPRSPTPAPNFSSPT